MSKLDRSRHFATVSGDDAGRFFWQDGQYFGADGSAWIDPHAEVHADAPAKAHKPKAHKPAAPVTTATDDQLNAQLGDAAA